MTRKTIILTISIIGIVVLLLSSLIVVMKNGYKADSGVNYRGKLVIYSPYSPGADQNGLIPVSGGEVLLICSSDSLPGTKRYSGFSNEQGFFSIPITNPSVCRYRIYAGIAHNWSQHGSVSLKRYLESPPSSDMQLPVFELDTEQDMMYSSYFHWYYREGYEGGYRLSKFDRYFVRQPINLDKLTEGIAPTGAKIKVKVKSVNDLFCMPGGDHVSEPGFVDPQKFFMHINVAAVNSDWKGAKGYNDDGEQPTVAGINSVGSKEIEINCQNYQTLKEFEIDVDYSAIPKEHRYYSYVNGFRLSATVTSGDPNYQGISYPFFVLERSEDVGTPAATIEYIGDEKYFVNKPGFEGPLANPVSDNATITSDFGWRGIKKSECHRGIDYDTERNTPIYAAADGVVDFVRPEGGSGYGVYIVIKHCNDMYTFYGHLNYGGIKVNVGDEVKAGQFIGLADNTGSSTGDHLHFSVAWKRWNNYYDPLLFFMGVSKGEILVEDWKNSPKRNKGKDPKQRIEWFKKDPCMDRKGWHYEI